MYNDINPKYKYPKNYLVYDNDNEDSPCILKTILDSSKQFDFGKYKGNDVKEIFESDVFYVEWCMLNVLTFMLTRNDFKSLIDVLQSSSSLLEKSRIEDLKRVYSNKTEAFFNDLKEKNVVFNWKEEDEEVNNDSDEDEYYAEEYARTTNQRCRRIKSTL
ncbi:MAG: hypothetical protein K8R85_12000 [Bacteroidetes bacterium]|nr:hypothetical protein [Bacteroidota bacterium]